MKYHVETVVAGLVMLGIPCFSQADQCTATTAKALAVDVNTGLVTRSVAPKEMFGFNVPWRDFQTYYMRNGAVRDDLYPYLTPFKGAVYRYPGGNPTNNFEWKKTVGSVSGRTAMLADYNNSSVPTFGLDEFGAMLNKVGGRALLTLNIYGKSSAPWTAAQASEDSVGMLKYVRDVSPFKCVTGTNCGVLGVELGNELDLAPTNWTAGQYVARAKAVVNAVNATSGLTGIQWIAAGRTSPWSSTDYSAYNATLAAGLASSVQGFSIHPYYDGNDIPYTMKFVNAFAKTWTDARPDAKLFITEHARWPKVPTDGVWRDNWYQATSLGGSISSVDFLITLMNTNSAVAANWHALGNSGPWNLIRVSKVNDKLYPSPVYWGLRTAREAYLDKVVQTKFTAPKATSGYSGGYDLKMVGMAAASGAGASVIGINRGTVPYTVTINWSAGKRGPGNGVLRITTAASTSTDNTDSAPNAVSMVVSQQALAERTSSTWCVPAQSVFSIVEP